MKYICIAISLFSILDTKGQDFATWMTFHIFQLPIITIWGWILFIMISQPSHIATFVFCFLLHMM